MPDKILQNGHAIGVVRPVRLVRIPRKLPVPTGLPRSPASTGLRRRCGEDYSPSRRGQTAIRHHGKQDTVVYALSGAALIRWGRHGEFSATAQPGDFVCVPAYLPHKEINLPEDAEFTRVVVRNKLQSVVVNLSDLYWSGGQATGGFFVCRIIQI